MVADLLMDMKVDKMAEDTADMEVQNHHKSCHRCHRFWEICRMSCTVAIFILTLCLFRSFVLAQHILNICTFCVKSFICSNRLATHLITHTGEKSHKCAQCNKSFSLAAHLKSHLLGHTEEKKHLCAQCDKSFRHAGNLKTHLLVHSGEKKYSCSNCNKSFSPAGSLMRHMFIHTGERALSSTHCYTQMYPVQ